MFIVNGADYTITVFGIIGALLMFAIQLTFCCKAKRTAVKLIPVYFILLCALFTAAIYAGVFGYGSGFIASNSIVAMILVVVIGIALIGEVLAWVVYRVYKRKIQLKQQNAKK